MRQITLIVLFIRFSLQIDFEYRANFFVNMINTVLTGSLALVTLLAFFDNTESIGGWGLYEMIALFGVAMILDGVIMTWLYPSLHAVSDFVRKGDFDFLLLKPINSQLYVSIHRFSIWEIPSILIGLGAVFYAMDALNSLSLINFLGFFILLVAGIALFYAIFLLTSTLAFWFTKVMDVWIITYTIVQIGKYPVSAYPKWSKILFTFIVPIFFLTNVPASAAMGTLDIAHAFYALVASFIAICLSSYVWHLGLRNYSSASS